MVCMQMGVEVKVGHDGGVQKAYILKMEYSSAGENGVRRLVGRKCEIVLAIGRDSYGGTRGCQAELKAQLRLVTMNMVSSCCELQQHLQNR